jgi:hypothetical protein
MRGLALHEVRALVEQRHQRATRSDGVARAAFEGGNDSHRAAFVARHHGGPGGRLERNAVAAVPGLAARVHRLPARRHHLLSGGHHLLTC